MYNCIIPQCGDTGIMISIVDNNSDWVYNTDYRVTPQDRYKGNNGIKEKELYGRPGIGPRHDPNPTLTQPPRGPTRLILNIAQLHKRIITTLQPPQTWFTGPFQPDLNWKFLTNSRLLYYCLWPMDATQPCTIEDTTQPGQPNFSFKHNLNQEEFTRWLSILAQDLIDQLSGLCTRWKVVPQNLSTYLTEPSKHAYLSFF